MAGVIDLVERALFEHGERQIQMPSTLGVSPRGGAFLHAMPAYLPRLRAIEEDGAHVIVLGCTGMSAAARPLAECVGVPVIDLASCAIKLARSIVEMGLSHSLRCYPWLQGGLIWS